MTTLRQSVTFPTCIQLAVELSWLVAAAVIALHLVGHADLGLAVVAPPAIAFAVLLLLLSAVFGIYRRGGRTSASIYVVKIVIVGALGVGIASATFSLFPAGTGARDALLPAVLLALGGLVVLRHVVVAPMLGKLPHRVLVLGTGDEAKLVEASLSDAMLPGVNVVGFCAVEEGDAAVVTRQRVVAQAHDLERAVRSLGVHEIVVAVRQQRGGVLPLNALLHCRLAGVEITELARHFERVHGKVPVDLLKASWLIYGDGFRQGVVRTVLKRAFDVVSAATLLVLASPIMIVTAAAIMIESGGSVIYRQQRIGFLGRPFTVLKFRSMGRDAEGDGRARWAAPRDPRVTRTGRIIRRLRIDELPQLVNIVRGEMSFVGPRPERPEFVELLSERIPFYGVRHAVKPGLTGWAQVRYPYGATVEQAARKLEYDLYYVKNHTLLLDVVVMLETVRVVLFGEGAV